MRKVLASGIIANSLEWYDYALYGLLTPTIGKLFFPSEDPFTSLIAAFCVFAAGFLMRPIGALLFGYIGDEYGRRSALVGAILLMAVPTACIGLLPTYQHIGIAAPILLTLLRLLQGLSLGGAFSGSMAFIIEHAPDKHRGIAGSSTMFSMVLGVLIGSVVAGGIASLCTPLQFEIWGWRIAFLLGIGAGLAGIYIRHSVDESPKYLQAKKEGALSSQPLKEVFAHHMPALIQVMGMILMLTIPFYTTTVYMISVMDMIGYSKSQVMLISTANMFVLLIFIPLSASISDRIGRKKLLMGVALLYLCATIPLFRMMCSTDFTVALTGNILFSIILGSYTGPLPAALVEAFPTKVRYTGMSLSYNFCIALFGGTVPLVAASLATFTNNHLAMKEWVESFLGTSLAVIALYITLAALFSVITLCFYKDRYREKL